MSDKLRRYSHSDVCEYLATQYVAGVMSSRVQSRMQNLIESNAEIRQAVEFWAENLSKIQYCLPEQKPSPKVLMDITRQLNFQTHDLKTHVPSSEKWWNKVWAWQLTSAVSLALAGFLVMNAVVQTSTVEPSSPVITQSGASYLAIMSLHKQRKTEFIISAYEKQEGQPSRLHVQWSEQSDKKWRNGVHLWSEDRKTGKIVYVGKKPEKGQPWNLEKSEWQTIANSGRLLMTNNIDQPTQANIIFSGECLQLKSWKKRVA